MVQRRAHFSYEDSAGMLTGNSDLNENCASVWSRRKGNGRARERLREHQAQLTQYSVLASLKSSYDAKRDMLKELQQEMQDIGVHADASAEERARSRRDELYTALSHNRARRNQLEKQLTFCEAEMDSLQKKLRKLERDYHLMREQVVSAKRAGAPCCAGERERRRAPSASPRTGLPERRRAALNVG